MDNKTKNKIVKKLMLAMPWYNEDFVTSILNEIIANPKIRKEELAFKRVRGDDRKTPICIRNEYIAQKYIDIVKDCTK